jgi:hypothetical protein
MHRQISRVLDRRSRTLIGFPRGFAIIRYTTAMAPSRFR